MRISRAGLALLSVALLSMLLALPFAISSGAITSEAHHGYLDAADPDDSDDLWEMPDEDGRRELIAVLASAAMSDVLTTDNISPLPIDNSPGRAPIRANFTETGYRDDTIIVEFEQRRLFDSDVFIAHVKIATPSQLRTAYAGTKMGTNRTNLTSRLCGNFNGIAAINGDYYTGTKAGYIVRQGEVYREKTSDNMDLLLIDEMGDFHIILRGKDVQKTGVAAFKAEHTLVNGFFFGPALVLDGEVQEIPKKYQFDPNGANPRAAIGQTGPLTYVMVVVNGRMEGSKGVTLSQLAEIMGELNCQQAYNLDGGNSATLAFRNQVYNDKPQAERSTSDIIYFATATQQGE